MAHLVRVLTWSGHFDTILGRSLGLLEPIHRFMWLTGTRREIERES